MIPDLKKGDKFYFFSASDMQVVQLVAKEFDNPKNQVPFVITTDDKYTYVKMADCFKNLEEIAQNLKSQFDDLYRSVEVVIADYAKENNIKFEVK